jgi:hypothetical protein
MHMDGYCLAELFEEESTQLSRPSVVVGRLGLVPTGHVAAIDRRIDDTYCWVCGATIVEMHCKIVCQHCGFTRDCSDP